MKPKELVEHIKQIKIRENNLLSFFEKHKEDVFSIEDISQEFLGEYFDQLGDDLFRLAEQKKIGWIDLEGRIWFGTNEAVDKLKKLLDDI